MAGFRWVKAPATEANMRRLGIAYEVKTVQMSQIDLAEGLRRQARLIGKLDQDYAIPSCGSWVSAYEGFCCFHFQRPWKPRSNTMAVHAAFL